ncbi:MAG: decaprenyl-phosphate phosphoribosyltransferase [Thermoleophilaceae bacterium]
MSSPEEILAAAQAAREEVGNGHGRPATTARARAAVASLGNGHATAAPPPQRAAAERSLPRALLVAVRPRQWLKNLLVLAAPLAAGVLGLNGVLVEVAAAFVAFCLAASGSYLLNDVLDVEADRRHPVKRMRPVAAGAISVRLASGIGIGMIAAALALAAAVRLEFLGVVVLYVAITTAYSLWLKHVAVVDLAVVASGFVLRAVAGGAAVGVPLSRWFLIVASFGSLFMVAGKRYGEHDELGEERASVRPTLAEYPREYLRYVWMLASGVAITAYCLWAFEQGGSASSPWYGLTIVPFVLGVLRYALLLESGRGSAPEDVVLGDGTLKFCGFAWVILFGIAVYVG